MNGKKTYIVAALMIVHALSGWATGHEVNLQELFTALGLAALRSGVKKAEKPGSLAPGLLSLFVASALFVPSTMRADEFNWEWTAPNPPLPGTEWYDYGWDSPSNGPVPAELAQRATPSPAGVRGEAVRLARNAPPAPVPPPAPPRELATVTLTCAEPRPGRVYFDSGLSFTTTDFSESEDGYTLRLGYQVSKHWSFDFGVGHHGLDFDGSAVQDLSGRVVARLPFEFLSPYTFVGGRRDLERREWFIEPGAGIEVGVSKALRGLSVYAEGKVSANVERREWKPAFEGGVRFRF